MCPKYLNKVTSVRTRKTCLKSRALALSDRKARAISYLSSHITISLNEEKRRSARDRLEFINGLTPGENFVDDEIYVYSDDSEQDSDSDSDFEIRYASKPEDIVPARAKEIGWKKSGGAGRDQGRKPAPFGPGFGKKQDK